MGTRSRAWVEVDLRALVRNLAAVRAAVAPGTGLIPMVKADAYGLGMPAVAEALRGALAAEGGPWAFGVAAVAEGEALRRVGWGGRVLVFSPAPPAEFERAARAELTLCLSDVDAVRRWAGWAQRLQRRLAFHTEVDTGMGRSGLPWREAAQWGEAVAEIARAGLRWEGVFTHFHSVDEPDLAPTQAQWERFRGALAALPPAPEAEPRRVHAANSAATLRLRGLGCDLVRPGLFLYGGPVGAEHAPEPVVAVRARLALVRDVEAGATAGYGATYTASARERWGTLPIGYGDGLPRALWPGGAEALVHGRRVPLIGRVSMDMTTVRLSEAPAASAGDVVTLVGRDDAGAEIALEEVARRAGTISYEILTGLTSRLPRIYLGPGNT